MHYAETQSLHNEADCVSMLRIVPDVVAEVFNSGVLVLS